MHAKWRGVFAACFEWVAVNMGREGVAKAAELADLVELAALRAVGRERSQREIGARKGVFAEECGELRLHHCRCVRGPDSAN